MNIKELFSQAENGTLTYEQFDALMKENGAKFADLSEGKYVSKSRYDTDIKAKDTDIASRDEQIVGLAATISARDTDLGELQKRLEEAGQDATKLAELNTQFSELQAKYDTDVQQYQTKMAQQAYEFAVKEFAGTQKFTSQAAKRDFMKAMIEKQLQMEDGKLVGSDEFIASYTAENADAFQTESNIVFEEDSENKVVVPEIVASAPGANTDSSDDGFQFHFTGVRAH